MSDLGSYSHFKILFWVILSWSGTVMHIHVYAQLSSLSLHSEARVLDIQMIFVILYYS